MPTIIAKHSNVQFYDYSKILKRHGRPLPKNYDLTFSLDGTNRAECIEIVKKGGRVAVVMNLGNRKGKAATKTPIFPSSFEGLPVVSGEANDNRFNDPSGVWVALTAKGDAVFDTSGFVVCRGDKGVVNDEQDRLQDPKTEGVKMRDKADAIADKLRTILPEEIHKAIDEFIAKKKKILTDGANNPKTSKGDEYNVILHLSPSDEAGVGNMCPLASLGCKIACLHTAGIPFQLGGKVTSRIVKTWYYKLRRKDFMAQLSKELTAKEKKADKLGKRLVARLNGTSDIQWEKVTA